MFLLYYFNIYFHMLETYLQYILPLFCHWIKHEKNLNRQFTEKNRLLFYLSEQLQS